MCVTVCMCINVCLYVMCKCVMCKLQGGPSSVRFGYGLETERFKRFRFSVPAVPLQKGFFCISVLFNTVPGRFRFRCRFLENGSGGSGSGVGFWKKRFRRFRFPVPVRFLSHPDNCLLCVLMCVLIFTKQLYFGGCVCVLDWVG